MTGTAATARTALPRLQLAAHPAGTDPVLAAVTVRIETAPGTWQISYRLHGAGARLCLPPPATPAAADGLWQHSCCEAFVGVAGEPTYHEFNFSPSGAWAAYAFTGPRQRDTAYRPPAAPRICCRDNGGDFELVAEIDHALLPAGRRFEVGLAVVAEARDGALAYWALRHPAAQPDFHRRDGFTLLLERTA